MAITVWLLQWKDPTQAVELWNATLPTVAAERWKAETPLANDQLEKEAATTKLLLYSDQHHNVRPLLQKAIGALRHVKTGRYSNAPPLTATNREVHKGKVAVVHAYNK